jgi:hypothetical protein
VLRQLVSHVGGRPSGSQGRLLQMNVIMAEELLGGMLTQVRLAACQASVEWGEVRHSQA